MPNEAWPPLPEELRGDANAIKARAEAIANAVIDSAKATRSAAGARDKSAELDQKLADTLATLTVGGVDRARAGAQFVQTAATAIAGLYTGILGVLFVSDHAAPSRSLIPMFFLGLAIVLATYYLAFIRGADGIDPPRLTADPGKAVWERLDYVGGWVQAIALPRAGGLRAGVLSLAFGLLFLPVGIIHVPSELPFAPGRTAGATPTAAPSPAQIAWPSPTPLADPTLTAILYTAQIEEFRKNLAAASTPGAPEQAARDENAAWTAAALALLVVLLVWWNPLGWFAPSIRPGQIRGPLRPD